VTHQGTEREAAGAGIAARIGEAKKQTAAQAKQREEIAAKAAQLTTLD